MLPGLSLRGVVWISAALVSLAVFGLAVRACQQRDAGLVASGRLLERTQWQERDRQDAEQRARETLRRQERQAENDRAQAAQLARLDADLRESHRVAGGLRHDLARFVAARRPSAGSDPAPGPGSTGQPGPSSTDLQAGGSDALDVLAGLFTRADDAAGELAEYADRLRIAGERCERDYDALRQVTP